MQEASYADRSVTAKEIEAWIAEMKAAKLARSAAACARLLGISATAMAKRRREGADRRTALAMRALLHRLVPYGDAGEKAFAVEASEARREAEAPDEAPANG